MAKLLSGPRRFLVFLLTLLVSLLQAVRALPSGRGDGVRHLSSKHRVDHGLLFRFAGARRHHQYLVEATGVFPYVRLVPPFSTSSVQVPLTLRALSAPLGQASQGGLQHTAIRGLSGPSGQAVKPPCAVEVRTPCGGSCGSCGGCGSCASCSSCSSCSCGSSCTSCGTSCTSCGGCAGNCGSCMGFGGSCGGSCVACASCASCLSCSSCTCTSCASCGSCGSCSSCVG
jgi:hypothetical protein